MTKKGVVILDNHAISYGLIRYIAHFKIPIILIYFEDTSICRFSKFVSKSIKLNYTDKKSFINQLISLSEKFELSNYILIPCDDKCIEYISKYIEKLSKYFIPICSDWNKIKVFYHKTMTYELCEKLKINYPKIYDLNNNVTTISKKSLYPVILKPDVMHSFFNKHKRKAILCLNPRELIEKYNQYQDKNYTLMVQEYIVGDADVLYSYAGFAQKGVIWDGITVHRRRQHPMRFGTASTFVVIKEVPKLKKIGNLILKETKYSGPFEIEFMYDKKVKDYKLLEVNARFWGWHTILSASGHDIIGKIIKFYLKLKDPDIENINKELKKYWVHLITDLYIIFKEGLKGNMNIKNSILSIRNCEYAIYNKEDLLPFLLEILTTPIQFLKRSRNLNLSNNLYLSYLLWLNCQREIKNK